MKTNFSRKFIDKEIETKCDEIIEYYNSNKNIHLDKKTTIMFVKYLFSVFSYELPSPLEFNEICDVNIFHIEETEPIEIKKSGKTKYTPKAKVNNNDLCFWTRNCKNHIELLCKTRYYETVNELMFIYEDIGDRAYSICNDNSDRYISEICFNSEKYYKMGMAVQKRMKYLTL